MLFWVLVAAAVAFVLWPTPEKPAAQPSLLSRLPSSAAPKPADTGSYMDAVKALQLVRGRLVATDKLDEAAQKNLDSLMLCLLAGSEK